MQRPDGVGSDYSPVEINTDWSSGNNDPWFSVGGTSGGFNGDSFISPTVQEGLTASHRSALGPIIENTDLSATGGFGPQTLSEGTYTIYFSLGDLNNLPLIYETFTLDFTGLTEADASSSSTPIPAPGDWQLWSFTWDVTGTTPGLGNPLSFSLTGTNVNGGNGGFDGVGGQSQLGSGFLVDFEPIPEPGTLVLGLIFGLTGLVARRRKS